MTKGSELLHAATFAARHQHHKSSSTNSWRDHAIGRLVELSQCEASARIQFVAEWIVTLQREDETVAWIEQSQGGLYPPDLAALGVKLDSLLIVQVPFERDNSSHAVPRAAEMLLRSGAFGLVVLDLCGARVTPSGIPKGAEAWHSRLAALAREHASTVVLLTPSTREERSVGSLVALRAECRRDVAGAIHCEILKNKLLARCGLRACVVRR